MTSKKPNHKTSIVFFGTGQTSLEALQCLSEDFEIELVITKPPASNSAGRKFKNPVQLWAEQNQLDLITPQDKTEMQTLLKSRSLSSSLAVVLDYGLIIPEGVISLFSKGILNSHFSLLPLHRGSNPIRAAILEGDQTTGVTIIRITPELDNGPILSWSELEIGPQNALQLRGKLSQINCGLLCETIRLYLDGQLEPLAQDESQASYTRKTTKEDGLINPAKTAGELYRELRAYAGWPKSYMEYNGKPLIIIEASASDVQAPSGQLQAIEGNLHLGCKDGSLLIKTLQPAGKAAMDAKAFINGYLR